MNKIIAIGDIHGRPIWKDIIHKEGFYDGEIDKVIFIGDYFDAKYNPEIDFIDEIKNFKKIIELKEEYPDKVILLFGNHDYHYIPEVFEYYTSFNQRLKRTVGDYLRECIRNKHLQICFESNGYLFSHAGISKDWLDSRAISHETYVNDINSRFWNENYDEFSFDENMGFSLNGNDTIQSPLWIRPQSLQKSFFKEGLTQVVGHTRPKNMIELEQGNSHIILIDTLGSTGEYLRILDIGIEFNKI